MWVDGVLGQPVVAYVRASFSRARVATAANCALLDFSGRSISGRGRVAEVLPLQEHGDFPEGRPLGLLASPTVQHQIVDILGARGRLRQVVEKVIGTLLAAVVLAIGVAAVRRAMQSPKTLHHFLVRRVLVGDSSAQVQDLPQGHRERPYVALRRVLALRTIVSCYWSLSLTLSDPGEVGFIGEVGGIQISTYWQRTE